MIENFVQEKKWKEEFTKKLSNMLKKCPASFRMRIDSEKGDSVCYITHIGTNKKYRYTLDYNENVKDFIAKIKQDISIHFPILQQDIYKMVELTPIEIAKKCEMSNSVEVDMMENRLIATKFWRIDKVILWKNTFILVNQNDKSEKQLYKFNGSSVSFLRNYRMGKFNSLKEAGDTFFSKAELIKVLEK